MTSPPFPSPSHGAGVGQARVAADDRGGGASAARAMMESDGSGAAAFGEVPLLRGEKRGWAWYRQTKLSAIGSPVDRGCGAAASEDSGYSDVASQSPG